MAIFPAMAVIPQGEIGNSLEVAVASLEEVTFIITLGLL
jgi:hypothetical protein